MRKFINNEVLSDKNYGIHFTKEYLKYMSILSRQLLSTIKQDFDPSLLTNDIDCGIWAQPEKHKRFMEFNIKQEQKKYSQYSLIQNAIEHFNLHFYNFYHLM